MSSSSREGWILAGPLDGQPFASTLQASIAGLPLLLRHAAELRRAGAHRIFVIWRGDPDEAPDLEPIAENERLNGCPMALVTDVPSDAVGEVLLARADRVFHRDLLKILADRGPAAGVRKIAGDEYDGVFAAEPEAARALAEAAFAPGGLGGVLSGLEARGELVELPPPEHGFMIPARDDADLRRGEKLLVSSLRKSADGYAARVFNRHVSLFFTRFVLMRTSVHPNVLTVLAFLSALTGGIVIGQGGYLAGVVGFLFVELGSILDGNDGELARLKCRYSRVGQWMDTVTDDISNVCYWTGTMMSLRAAGVEWAFPVWAVAVASFAITQGTQYFLIAKVYNSGDLAAIPWAFQSTEFLSSRPKKLLPRLKAGLPKFLKRDFAVTLFLFFALIGRLDLVLLVSATGAISFLLVFVVQFLRTGTRSVAREERTA